MAEQPAPMTMQGLDSLLGLRLTKVEAREVSAELTVGPHHHQPSGIVHGGVYCSIVETVCSVGAYAALPQGAGLIVGVDNHTSFLKATRSGTLRASARPLKGGKRTQLWEANIVDEQGDLVATGRVRLMTIEPGRLVAGQGTRSG